MGPEEIIDKHECLDYDNIVTPINADLLKQLLLDTHFDKQKISKLIEGFESGFDIGYQGSCDRKDVSDNLLFTVGSPVDMWNKIMKEVKLQRYAGPFTKEQIPYDHYVQSPIGLVPKAGGKTRLIFHLSYQFTNGNPSVNAATPKHLCTVKYKDLDQAVRNSIEMLNKLGWSTTLFYGKTDLESAFRILPIKPGQRFLLLLKAKHPRTKTWFYFIDKCLPFGSSISCAHFQLFSDALAAILEHQLNIRVTNYLDDFLFISDSPGKCDNMVRKFLLICENIGCPVSEEKTIWLTDIMIFLGILLDRRNHVLAIPDEKKNKALHILNFVIDSKKITIKDVQKLTGLLNFLQRAIIPGRTFTRRLYDKLKLKDKKGCVLKPYHHINITKDIKNDCAV